MCFSRLNPSFALSRSLFCLLQKMCVFFFVKLFFKQHAFCLFSYMFKSCLLRSFGKVLPCDAFELLWCLCFGVLILVLLKVMF